MSWKKQSTGWCWIRTNGEESVSILCLINTRFRCWAWQLKAELEKKPEIKMNGSSSNNMWEGSFLVICDLRLILWSRLKFVIWDWNHQVLGKTANKSHERIAAFLGGDGDGTQPVFSFLSCEMEGLVYFDRLVKVEPPFPWFFSEHSRFQFQQFRPRRVRRLNFLGRRQQRDVNCLQSLYSEMFKKQNLQYISGFLIRNISGCSKEVFCVWDKWKFSGGFCTQDWYQNIT